MRRKTVVLVIICIAALAAGIAFGVSSGKKSSVGISESAEDTVSAAADTIFTGTAAGSSDVLGTSQTTTASVTDATTKNGTAAADTAAATAPVEKAAAGVTLLPTPTIVTMDENNWQLTLLNIYYKMDESYVPTLAPAITGSSEQLDYRVAPYYQQMYDAAKAAGADITPCSGYRSYALQTKNYNRKIQSYLSDGYSEAEAEALAAQAIMPPGCSEHNYGLCMDIGWVDQSFENGSGYAWLIQHAADYGFILRYPKDKTDVTKVEYEPWHWRYVGVENAKAIKASGLCLEEYLGKVN